MPKKLFLLLFLSIISFNTSVFADVFPFTGRAVSADINVRAGQSTNFEKLAQLNKDQDVKVLGEKYNWYEIRLPDDSSLYIHTEYVSSSDLKKGVVTGNRVNLRARAEMTSTVMGQVVKGDQVIIIGAENEWLRIKPLETTTGWVHKDLLVFQSKDVSQFDREEFVETSTPQRAKTQPEPMATEEPLVQAKPAFTVSGILEWSDHKLPGIQYMMTLNGQTLYYVSGMNYLLDKFVSFKVELKGSIDAGKSVMADTRSYPVIEASRIQIVY